MCHDILKGLKLTHVRFYQKNLLTEKLKKKLQNNFFQSPQSICGNRPQEQPPQVIIEVDEVECIEPTTSADLPKSSNKSVSFVKFWKNVRTKKILIFYQSLGLSNRFWKSTARNWRISTAQGHLFNGHTSMDAWRIAQRLGKFSPCRRQQREFLTCWKYKNFDLFLFHTFFRIIERFWKMHQMLQTRWWIMNICSQWIQKPFNPI